MNNIIASLNQELSFVSVGGSVKPGRLLAKPLGVRIMDIDVTGRLYGLNGFRFIANPASADAAWSGESDRPNLRNTSSARRNSPVLVSFSARSASAPSVSGWSPK